MQALLAPLKELAEYEEIQALVKKKQTVALSGLVDSQKLHMMYGLSDGFKYKVIVTYSDLKAKELYDYFCQCLLDLGVKKVDKGIFGADMQVSLVNDGPVTILYDTDIWSKK